jgi:SAM-dependent methyltransferase
MTREIGSFLYLMLCYTSSMEKYQDINARAITSWIAKGWEWGKPIDHRTYEKAKKGDWDVVLTPTKAVPHSWFGSLQGKRILGLASGGGQQMPIFAALGGICTVFDYTPAQLESERLVAEREHYAIRIVQGDMSEPLPFEDNSFDLIFFPVSNVYIEHAKPVFKECFRVLRSGGILLSGLDNGINFITDEEEKEICNSLPFNPLKNEDQRKQLEKADGGIEFSHTLDEQIGGQLEAGFILKDLYEDTNGDGRLHEMNIPTFFATKALKP